jgi:hypothetical protein
MHAQLGNQDPEILSLSACKNYTDSLLQSLFEGHAVLQGSDCSFNKPRVDGHRAFVPCVLCIFNGRSAAERW